MDILSTAIQAIHWTP